MSKIINWKALDLHVLVVAVKRDEGCWCAYIKDTPGDNYEKELERVKNHGNKLPKTIALAIFPMYEEIPYAW